MTPTDSAPPSNIASGRRRARSRPTPARIRLASDGVVASYIREISARTFRGPSAHLATPAAVEANCG